MLSSPAFRVLLAVVLLSFQLFPSSTPSVSQAPAKLIDPNAGPRPTLEQIVEKLAVRAEKLGCKSDGCVLLVANFATAPDSTSKLGVTLADQFASLFSKTLPKGRVVDRSVFQQFLARERIPSKLLSEVAVERWLGKELGATVVLLGNLDFSSSIPQALFTIITWQPEKQTDGFGTELPPLTYSPEDLQPSEPFGPVDVPKTTKSGDPVYRVGVSGVSSPNCYYMPNPAYTDEAREGKLSGTILFDAVVTPEGTLEGLRIIRGFPYGLNETTLETAKTWRCKPALKGDQPVATELQFEVNFRLY